LREFDDDGVMLSGGEAQKTAIARAFYKDCPYVILDEPSANLDPIAEYNLNQAMIEAADQKTVIFISHRLSTTVNADRIYVMENGRIIESGSHQELMELDGTYAYMFNLQAEKYKTE
jgi:ATP-binding cassette subfamily B protein